MDKYGAIVTEFTNDIENAVTVEALTEVKIKYLGKKGVITELNKNLGKLPADERPAAGVEINKVREKFNDIFNAKEDLVKNAAKYERLASEKLDITLSGIRMPAGSLHPIQQTYDEIVSIFSAMGYEVATGPEVELDFYNFEALNIQQGHPARDMQDTFYVSDNLVMRTHTSPVQIRTMLSQKPPIKVIAPGKVYRSDHDITHSPMFHQVEGLLVDKNITLGNLKGTLTHFIHEMFGDDIPVRFRSSFFPFTEPSMEVDMGCVNCKGKGCRVCKGTGWLEICGSGLVAPEVFNSVNIDYNEYSGFAFGMGIERIAMLKYGIDDLRLFFENSMKFLSQF